MPGVPPSAFLRCRLVHTARHRKELLVRWRHICVQTGVSGARLPAPSALPRQCRLKYEVTYGVQQKRRRGAKPRFPSGLYSYGLCSYGQTEVSVRLI